jgi:hypothetical protein
MTPCPSFFGSKLLRQAGEFARLDRFSVWIAQGIFRIGCQGIIKVLTGPGLLSQRQVSPSHVVVNIGQRIVLTR